MAMMEQPQQEQYQEATATGEDEVSPLKIYTTTQTNTMFGAATPFSIWAQNDVIFFSYPF